MSCAAAGARSADGAPCAGAVTEGVGMGALTQALKRLWVACSVLGSYLLTALSRTDHLHQARFARVHELSRLSTPDLEEIKTRLLLGVGPHQYFVGVRGTTTRPELGNLLVVAPTRGGRACSPSASSSPGSIVVSSMISRVICTGRPPGTGRASARSSSLIPEVWATATTPFTPV